MSLRGEGGFCHRHIPTIDNYNDEVMLGGIVGQLGYVTRLLLLNFDCQPLRTVPVVFVYGCPYEPGGVLSYFEGGGVWGGWGEEEEERFQGRPPPLVSGNFVANISANSKKFND